MSSDERQAAAAGWYPDPGHPEQQRWWNGAAWSEDTQLTPEAIAAQGVGRPGVPLWGKIVLGALAVTADPDRRRPRRRHPRGPSTSWASNK